MRDVVLPWAIGSATVLVLTLAASAEPVSGDRLRAEVSGNTLTGFNTSGVVFSEFHSPDGRIFGHNNSEVVVDGCWDIKNDAICYYYARGTRPGTYCWRFDRAGPAGYGIASTESAVTGVVRLERGNPRGHSDQGVPWTCEGLTSGLEPARRVPLG
jgi:hypothetical protein